jgi:hypothetical protein
MSRLSGAGANHKAPALPVLNLEGDIKMAIGRQDYEERRQDRIDRLNNAASKAAERSLQYSKHSNDLVKDIPFGQPNIIGRPALPHLREKSARAMDKSIEESKKSDYYADRATAAENNHAISSDDPEAVEKLKAKITVLEARREEYKAFNKKARKEGMEPLPWYALPYLSKDIKRLKDRIARLEQIDNMSAETIKFDGGEIISDVETNRVKIVFDERQSDNVVEKLKHSGFHWSPTEKAWQRLRTVDAMYAAKRIVQK